MEQSIALGVDFGTLSARALLLDLQTGRELGSGVCDYVSGVITESLPNGKLSQADFALQDPADYLTAMEQAVKSAISGSGCNPDCIAAIGIDFTSSTVLPLYADGSPLCFDERYRSNPHAWCKLWKHHGPDGQAQRMTELARQRGERWLENYGGSVSGEYLLPKLLETLECAPEVYHAADTFAEAGDWIVWQLCGRLCRSSCMAGFKSLWDAENGYPSSEYFAALNPEFADVTQSKLKGRPSPVANAAGGLLPYWAKRLGLRVGIPVAVAVIDAHASVAGCGISTGGRMLMIIGTSTCHIMLDKEKTAVGGISGVVKDGILGGFYAYEAGQSCVGDSFSWYLNNCLPKYCCDEAMTKGQGIHEYLRERAERLQPGQSGLLALDWLNGVRSPLMDFGLSGTIVGLTLSTKPEEIYRAFIEATAFGARQIVEGFRQSGVTVNEIYATGGIAAKDPMTMQIYADVLGLPVRVAGGRYSGARGSAIYAAAAMPGSIPPDRLIEQLGDVGSRCYTPTAQGMEAYNTLFLLYRRLYKSFGGGDRDIMYTLRQLRAKALGG